MILCLRLQEFFVLSCLVQVAFQIPCTLFYSKSLVDSSVHTALESNLVSNSNVGSLIFIFGCVSLSTFKALISSICHLMVYHSLFSGHAIWEFLKIWESISISGFKDHCECNNQWLINLTVLLVDVEI